MKKYFATRIALVTTCVACTCSAGWALGEEKHDLLKVVRRYADTMIEKGRDTYGPEKSLLLLSALDRRKPAPLTTCPAAPTGVRDMDRVGQENGPLVGANPSHDQNLLRLLYALSEITGEPRYRQAADAELKWFFTHTAWPQTGLLPWGEHMSWDVMADKQATRCREPRHELGKPWMLWDRSYELAPEGCAAFADALWEHQIYDHKTGAFDRHASPHKHKPGDDYDLPRHAGMYIYTWSKAYKHTRDEKYLHYIDVLLSRFEKRRDPNTKLIGGWHDDVVAWPLSSMSLALECHASADDVPKPLADRLRAFALAEDEAFLAMDHDPAGRGFVVSAILHTGEAVSDIGVHHLQDRTRMWGGKGGEATTAMEALICVARNEQVPNESYRKLILTTARKYLNAEPEAGQDLWPLATAQAITLQMAAYRLTGDKAHLDWARKLADDAVDLFWAGNPLPKASAETDHYETLTGGDTLALALLDVALADTPDADKVPANTIDR